MSTASNPLAQAIAWAEGFGKPGAVPTTANNPGDLKVGDVGSGTTASGITVFPDAQSGWDALNSQVAKMLNGSSNFYTPDNTIAQAGQTYAAGDPNWAKHVASYLGVDPNTTLGNAAGNGSSSSTSSTDASNNPLGANAPFSATNPLNSSTGLLGSLSPARWAGGIIGIIAIAVGLLMFKQTQSIIIGSGKAVVKGAELLA
jgi:hypothetical protein